MTTGYLTRQMWTNKLNFIFHNYFPQCYLQQCGCIKVGANHDTFVKKLEEVGHKLEIKFLTHAWRLQRTTFKGAAFTLKATVSISGLCLTFHHFSLCVSCKLWRWQSASDQSNHRFFWQLSQAYKFSLVTSGCQMVTDWSMGLWSLIYLARHLACG